MIFMKTLFLIRHAKSSWDYPDLMDFERPLNKRGRTAAPFMAGIMKNHKFEPELILSSPASRAAVTALIFAEVLGYSSEQILYDARIYSNETDTLISLIESQSDNFNSILLAGHNPSISGTAEKLSGVLLGDLPTCAIVGIKFEIGKWSSVSKVPGEMFFHEYPKKFGF